MRVVASITTAFTTVYPACVCCVYHHPAVRALGSMRSSGEGRWPFPNVTTPRRVLLRMPPPPRRRPYDRSAYENHFSAIRFSPTVVYRDPRYHQLKSIFILFYEIVSRIMVSTIRVLLIHGCKSSGFKEIYRFVFPISPLLCSIDENGFESKTRVLCTRPEKH